MGWGAFIWFIVSLIASVALAPKPPKPRAATIEDFDLPTAELDRPLPVLFGTKRITGPNVLWYGDLAATRLKERTLFSSTTIGFKYHLGLHFGACTGPVDEVQRIEVGDRSVAFGSYTANTNLDVQLLDLFGGKKKEGGMEGRLAIMMGAPDQAPNAYLASVIAGPMPAFRGMLGFVWERGDYSGYIGNTPYPKPWSFTCKRLSAGWHNDSVWYPEKIECGNGMNPAHIIYQVLTDPNFGQGSPAAQLNDQAFRNAADQLFDEGLGLNLLWNQSSQVDDFLQIVVDHVGGVLGIDPANNQYVLILFRDDYDAGTLDEYGPDEISEMRSLQTQAWGETVNELTVTYTDPETLKSIPLTVQDLANIRNQGGVVSESIDRSGISNVDMIKGVAARELAQRSTPLWQAQFVINRHIWQKTVGDVFKLTWPRPAVSSVVFRVIKLGAGTLEDGSIIVDAVEDIYARQGLSYATGQPAAAAPDPLPVVGDDATNPNVLSASNNAPPPDPADGDRYLIPASPAATGAWAGEEGRIAEWDDAAGEWLFFDVPIGVIIYDEETNQHITTDGAGNVEPFEGGGGGGIGVTGTPAASARVERTTDQSIATATVTPIVWDSQQFDTDDFWPEPAAVELSRLVANFTGHYLVTANIAWDASTDGDRILTLRKNGTTVFASTRHAAFAGLEQNLSSMIRLVENDYIEAVVEQSAAGAVDVVASTGMPHLSISRIRTQLTPTLLRGATWARADGVLQTPTNPVALYFAKPAVIHSITLLGGPTTGSCTVDIWKKAFASYPPVVGDSIVGGTLPEINAASTYFDNVLDGWDTAIAAGDVLFFNLTSTAGFHHLFAQIEIREVAE